jgi:hypothetical protein
MAVPTPQSPVWQRLATGALPRLRTQNMGIQLMAKRMERTHASPADKAAEIHGFFAKWERVLQAEIQQLASL